MIFFLSLTVYNAPSLHIVDSVCKVETVLEIWHIEFPEMKAAVVVVGPLDFLLVSVELQRLQHLETPRSWKCVERCDSESSCLPPPNEIQRFFVLFCDILAICALLDLRSENAAIFAVGLFRTFGALSQWPVFAIPLTKHSNTQPRWRRIEGISLEIEQPQTHKTKWPKPGHPVLG